MLRSQRAGNGGNNNAESMFFVMQAASRYEGLRRRHIDPRIGGAPPVKHVHAIAGTTIRRSSGGALGRSSANRLQVFGRSARTSRNGLQRRPTFFRPAIIFAVATRASVE